MRKKIEELRNREEGFTLVELLAVIVILGIIVAIAIPVIGNVTERAQSGADEAQEELVVDAAQLYMVENQKKVVFDGKNGTIDVKTDLIANGYLEDDEKLSGQVNITRELISGTDAGNDESYTYTYSYDLPERD